jgi:hypothetical protein
MEKKGQQTKAGENKVKLQDLGKDSTQHLQYPVKEPNEWERRLFHFLMSYTQKNNFAHD